MTLDRAYSVQELRVILLYKQYNYGVKQMLTPNLFVLRSGGDHTCVKQTCPESQRRDSLAQLTKQVPRPYQSPPSNLALLQQRSFPYEVPDVRNKPELTCISEEGIADMDLPDHLLEELEYLGDCITSCNKVENYLIMSEYENNLGKTTELPYILDKKGRKKIMSLTRQSSSLNCKDSPKKKDRPPDGGNSASSSSSSSNQDPVKENIQSASQRELPSTNKSGNNRSITVIEEASV